MHKTAVATVVSSSEGFLLLDSTMNPIFVNPAAAQILIYPQKVETQKKLGDSVASKMRSMLLAGQSSRGQSFVSKFHSGKRLYLCRAFRVNSLAKGHYQPSVAVLLERSHERSASLMEVSERFRLTAREQEVIQYLLHGLTSKEVAMRMGISANTVKAFLRLIMVKMGVSTRSGIVGRAFAMLPSR